MIPTLRIERLALSPVTEGDLDAMLALWTDPDVRRYLWDDRVVSRDEPAAVLDDLIAISEDGLGLWIVRAGDEDAVAGCVGLRPTPQPGVEPLAAFHPRYWGRGYATEALRALLEYAFGTLGFPSLSAIVDEPNEASARLVERLGFRRTEMVMGEKNLLLGYVLDAPDPSAAPDPRP